MKTEKMKHRVYRKPAMRFVELQYRTHLLQMSDPEEQQKGGRRQDYESQEW